MLSQQRWFQACAQGDVILVQQNLDFCARSQDSNGNTGLIIAVQNNHVPVFDLLL